MIVYAIGGLGADERVFSRITLDDECRVLPWLLPDENERFESYALRMCGLIDQFVLLGVSFGGMLAVEMSKIISPSHVILISSSATRSEVPLIYRVVGWSGLLWIIPHQFLRIPLPVAYWLFGVRDRQSRRLLREIMEDTNLVFLKWAMLRIVTWSSMTLPASLTRIHGDRDRVLPRGTHPDTVCISGGGHFMIVDCATRISEELNQIVGGIKEN